MPYDSDEVKSCVPNGFCLLTAAGLLIMAHFAQRLPVVLIPEQLRIAAMRNDVIDDGCGFQPTVLSAFHTQRILPQVQLSRGAPFGIISSRCAAAADYVRGILAMQLTIDVTVAIIRAPRKPAWTFGCMRHMISPFSANDEHYHYQNKIQTLWRSHYHFRIFTP